jgi:proline iminopeptidase
MKLKSCLTLLCLPAALAAQQSGYVTVSDGARLFYRTSGHPGPGVDTLIAIHGGPGLDLGTIYNDLALMFGDRHVVIYYDQRGGGRSELPADTTRLVAARQIQDLDDIRKHFGLQRVTLVAHSYGPLLAGSYALAHPEAVKKMVFFGPVPPMLYDSLHRAFWERYSAEFRARTDSADNAGMRAASQLRRSADTADQRKGCRDYWKIAVKPRLADPAHIEVVKSDLCGSAMTGIRYGGATGNRVIMGSYGDWDLRPRLKTLQVPLLVVHGERETIPMDMVAYWASTMPHAELFKVPNAAHFAYAEQPLVVWPKVERFLSGR